MRSPKPILTPAACRDMTAAETDLLGKRIDALWRPPEESDDRLPADPATDLLAGVAIAALVEDIERRIDEGKIRFRVDRLADEMIARPIAADRDSLHLWQILTIHNAGLPLRRCAECGGLYAPPNMRATRFCSTRCRNANTVRAHRERQKSKSRNEEEK